MLRKYQRNSSILMLLTVRDIKTIFFDAKRHKSHDFLSSTD